ncbi:MAG: polyprenyl synthetase family protein, partial [Mariprofundaceae bacterium]
MRPPEFLADHAERIDAELENLLAERAQAIPERLLAAMRHSLLGGGKRVRPALVLECSAVCGGSLDAAMPLALAVECMHTYSLIHDDLPCMDDDDLRRGRPTCHRAFDEATAVLAGDALQALAFELACGVAVAEAAAIAQSLAVAAGARGMVGGQMLDIEAEAGGDLDWPHIERIHVHKTGALIRWCCEAGARVAGADPATVRALVRYGEAVGLLFQIADDILDATASTEALGKSAGKDARQRKATSVTLLGIARAHEMAAEMHA